MRVWPSFCGVRKIAQACQGRQNARASRIPFVGNMVKDGIVGKAALLILTPGTFWRRCRHVEPVHHFSASSQTGMELDAVAWMSRAARARCSPFLEYRRGSRRKSARPWNMPTGWSSVSLSVVPERDSRAFKSSAYITICVRDSTGRNYSRTLV